MLLQMIRKYVRKNHSTWASYLPLFEFAYNSAVNTTIGMPPFVAELARMPLMPVSMLIPQDTAPAPPRPIRQYVQDLQTQLTDICQQVLTRDEQVVDSRNLIPAGSDEIWLLLPGDEVLVHAPYLSTHTDHPKHFMAWKGPFFVSKEIAEDVFEIAGMEAGIPMAYHRSKLKRYHRHDPEQPRMTPAPAPLQFIDRKVEYEIEEVLDHREVRGRRQYLLQWKGTPETSWEWEDNMQGCLDLLQDYLLRIGESGRVLPPGLTSEVPASTPGGAPTSPPPPSRRSTRRRRRRDA